MTTLEERFWSRVDASGDCWEWTGSRGRGGYGHTYIGGGRDGPRFMSAHRHAYELLVGPVAKDLQIDHLCRNHSCVNPDHLEPVTPRVNTLRSPLGAGARSRLTHCPQGHEYDVANTYVSKRNQRFCRACNRASHHVRKARRMAAA